MLGEFALKNFKALTDVTLSLGGITVLIGPNGTGKSSVLQALALLKQSSGQDRLVTSGNAIDLGGYDEVVHRRAKEKFIEFRLVAPLPEVELATEGGTTYRDQFKRVTYEATFDHEGLLAHTIELGGLGHWIGGSWDRVGGWQVEPLEIAAGPCTIGLGATNAVGEVIRISGVSSPSGVEPSFVEAVRAAYRAVFFGIREALARTYIVPAIRGFDKPAYPLQEAPVDDFFTARGPEEQASRVLSTIAYRRELEEAISELSQRALGLRMRARLIPDRRVSAEAYDGARTNLVNEGFGANQLMVLLAQMVTAPEGSLLGIEEPEIHLHPRAQAMLAEIFAEVATGASKQILLTTHNEHVLMALLTQVATGGLKPEDLRIYYFQKDELGVASAEVLEVDKRGRLKGGLKGFFEANVDELEGYLKALSEPEVP